jgi:hypothetical protein
MICTEMGERAASSLVKRRVLYQIGPTRAEGVVTAHDLDKGTVTVLNTRDGSFWRGADVFVEVIV